MTPPDKPEWIELAEADSAPQVKKVNRAFPALVLAAALSIGGIGILFAQNGTEAPASAEVQSAAVTATSSPATDSAPATQSATSAPGAATMTNNPVAPKQPGIAAMPTRGGDDDEDDDRDGEHRKGGDREREDHDDDEGHDD